jgi:hypothetical protein
MVACMPFGAFRAATAEEEQIVQRQTLMPLAMLALLFAQ